MPTHHHRRDGSRSASSPYNPEYTRTSTFDTSYRPERTISGWGGGYDIGGLGTPIHNNRKGSISSVVSTVQVERKNSITSVNYGNGRKGSIASAVSPGGIDECRKGSLATMFGEGRYNVRPLDTSSTVDLFARGRDREPSTSFVGDRKELGTTEAESGIARLKKKKSIFGAFGMLKKNKIKNK